MSDTKSIKISRFLIYSIITSLFISFVLLFIIHCFGSYAAYPENISNSQNSDSFTNFELTEKVRNYFLACPTGEKHLFYGNGKISMEDVIGSNLSGVKVEGYLISIFDDHWFFIISITILATVVILFLKKYNFKIS